MSEQALSVLSDGTILELVQAERIRIDPWDRELVQPASVDLRLGDSFRVFHNYRVSTIDLRSPPDNLTEEVVVSSDEAFIIHPGEFCLGRTLEWIELPDDIVARIEGKALALETPVPTPDGWRTMGELEPGDWVFDRSGNPTPVVATSETLRDRPCRTVEFSDGTTVIADIEHRWQVWIDRSHAPRLLTTGEIEQALASGAIPLIGCTGAVRYPARELPLDPYLLGTWLASDFERGRPVAVSSAGAPPLRSRSARASRARSPVVPTSVHAPTPTSTSVHAPISTSTCTCAPARAPIARAYLEADVPQRQALLAGIMDAAGSVGADGECHLAAATRSRAEGYRELIASLGYEPVARRTGATGRPYEVRFTPREPVFRLPGKLARQKLLRSRGAARAITAISRCESVPVRCIQVGSPDGVFLITRSFIPTHNSSLGRLGLIVHATAGFCDPGWKGTLTLELNNLTRVPIKLYPGLLIAQLSFMALDRPALRPYGSPELGSHYQGQRAATESRYEGARDANVR